MSAFGVTFSESGDSAVRESVTVQLPISWAIIFVLVVVASALVVGVIVLLRRYRRPSYRFQG